MSECLPDWGRPATPPAPLTDLAARLISESKPMDPEIAEALTPEVRWGLYEGPAAPAAPEVGEVARVFICSSLVGFTRDLTMSECLPDFPRYVKKAPDGSWHGADHQNGPWRPIPAPQSGLPWRTDGPAVPESREPASVAVEVRPLSPADRMALALCVSINGAAGCPIGPCSECKRRAAAVAHEIARQLRERYGSSTTADWLDGMGCHSGTVQGGN